MLKAAIITRETVMMLKSIMLFRSFLNIGCTSLVEGEHIAYAADGFDADVLREQGEFFTQEGDLNLHVAVVGVGIPAPEFFDDGVGGDGEAFVADEQFEELAFFEGEVEFLGLAEQVE